MNNPLRVAIIGSRGYPYVYSGYETLVKVLAERLTQKEVQVTVYCHTFLFKKRPKQIGGIHLKYIPTLKSKILAQPIHSFLAFCHVLFLKVDVVLVLNVSNGPFGLITKLFNIPTMMNVDGLEWLRPKWKGFGSIYFKWAAKMATKFIDLLVTDAIEMQKVYEREFHAKSVVITYGAESNGSAQEYLLSHWKLVAQDYYLIVGRMIPDNNADKIIEGFIQTNTTKKLVIVGDVPYADNYANKIKTYSDERLLFTGYVTDPNQLASLYQYCYAYLHGHEFGGTNPSLLKAMANGCSIAALDTPFSREVLQNDLYGYYFSKNSKDITRWLDWAEHNSALMEQRRKEIYKSIQEKYTWETVTNLYLYHLNKLAKIN